LATPLSELKLQNLSWGFLAVVWVLMSAFLLWGRGGVLDLLDVRRQAAALETEVCTLRHENERIEDQIRMLETHPEAYEGPAREMLFRKKKGEIVLYLAAASNPTAEACAVPAAAGEAAPTFDSWLPGSHERPGALHPESSAEPARPPVPAGETPSRAGEHGAAHTGNPFPGEPSAAEADSGR